MDGRTNEWTDEWTNRSICKCSPYNQNEYDLIMIQWYDSPIESMITKLCFFYIHHLVGCYSAFLPIRASEGVSYTCVLRILRSAEVLLEFSSCSMFCSMTTRQPMGSMERGCMFYYFEFLLVVLLSSRVTGISLLLLRLDV